MVSRLGERGKLQVKELYISYKPQYGRTLHAWSIRDLLLDSTIEKQLQKLYPVQYSENIGPTIRHSDWVILFIDLLSCQR